MRNHAASIGFAASETELVHIGFGGVLAANRIVAILAPDSAPVKRMIRNARKSDTAIDMTYGRKTKAVVILDSGHIALAALQPETIVNRIKQQRGEING
ncbi:MAG: DUF370 domain-containing protein [Chloroflexi bacterium]|nr:DUF370 domain-containing protein [Chloroflexota bacterium]MCL5952848.1 DUF370 domain-containing protein [Chloroflexota bacterium]